MFRVTKKKPNRNTFLSRKRNREDDDDDDTSDDSNKKKTNNNNNISTNDSHTNDGIGTEDSKAENPNKGMSETAPVLTMGNSETSLQHQPPQPQQQTETEEKDFEKEEDGDDDKEEEISPLIVIRRKKHEDNHDSNKNNNNKIKTHHPSRKRGLNVMKGDDDNNPNDNNKKKSKKRSLLSKKNVRNTTSFIIDEDEEDMNTLPRNEASMFSSSSSDFMVKKKNKNKNIETKAEEDDEEQMVRPTYGKEALQALRAAQDKVVKPQDLETTETTSSSTITIIPPQQPSSQHLQSNPSSLDNNKDQEELNFISLRGKREMDPIIRAGHDDDDDGGHHEDGTLLLGKDGMPIILEDPQEDEDDENNNEDHRDWEEQVSKRAGISPPPRMTTNNNMTSRLSSSSSTPSGGTTVTPTLKVLYQTLQGTVQHLSEQEEGIKNGLMRRQADLAQTIADQRRHTESMKVSGKACDDYQKLRYHLTMWVGAIRDLDNKVRPIQTSLLEMVSQHLETVEKEWKHWHEDVVVTLDQSGFLDRVLGRRSMSEQLGVEITTTQQDEFGRDIGSQLKRDRENRFLRRRKRAQDVTDKHGHYDLMGDLFSLRDVGSDRRYDLLQEALRLAVDDLDETYASPKSLNGHFERWKEDYPDEYRQCYAHLSLGDLIHVFDQVELCRSPWLRIFLKDDQDCFNIPGKFLYPSNTAILSPQILDAEGEDQKAFFERFYGKDFIPFLTSVLRENPLLIFLSEPMSRLFGNSITQITEKIGYECQPSRDMSISIRRSVERTIQHLSIPLLTTSTPPYNESNERIVDSMTFVKEEQPKWIRGLLMNLLTFWIPIVQRISNEEEYESLGRVILDFLSETYLFFLTSLSNFQLASEHFSPIWNLLLENHSTLLESPDFILHSAPLRAAALAYGLPVVHHHHHQRT